MKLFKTAARIILETGSKIYEVDFDWDELINRDELFQFLERHSRSNPPIKMTMNELSEVKPLAPIGRQEVWAAGVTYLRSRDARMEESKTGGHADVYDKVYKAERPELFFKALPSRVAAHGEEVYIRKDSKWNVPEPELTLYINSHGTIQGYTVGNDMSSRDIEGENPLYLPQAKVYERSAALGPCLYVPSKPIGKETGIRIRIEREGKEMFAEQITLDRMKRNFEELASWLFRECEFEFGCFLMTGTGMVPPNDFSLQIGDAVEISIDEIGSLRNVVAVRP